MNTFTDLDLSDFYEKDGFLRKKSINDDTPPTDTLPSGLSVNGGVVMAGSTTVLPDGLSSNGGVVITDGRIFYHKTFSNGGVLSVINF